uniref:PWI domain-containing protein n=1 Tax=Pseudo-nitzschia australis TaxID=44445 RepID=A0A7S4ELM8_9STRA
MPSVKGTASVSDSRARTKALRTTRFPRNYRKSVDLEKVNKAVLTQWIEQKITSILGFDDEIVSSTAINLFVSPSPSNANANPDSLPTPSHPSNSNSNSYSCDPKQAQLDLAGFLGDKTATFCSELWSLMLEAQASASGIPQTLLEQKKKEMAEKLLATSSSSGGAGASNPGQPQQQQQQ